MKRSAFTLPLFACIASIATCLLYAVGRPYLSGWLRDHGGGVPYTVFWILLWITLIPQRRWLTHICVACVLVTCGLELFQLQEGPVWLQNFRRTTAGAAWLGRSFDWLDFPAYLAGGGGRMDVGTRIAQANTLPTLAGRRLALCSSWSRELAR